MQTPDEREWTNFLQGAAFASLLNGYFVALVDELGEFVIECDRCGYVAGPGSDHLGGLLNVALLHELGAHL